MKKQGSKHSSAAKDTKRHVKKGDFVEIIAGKDKGKRGKILRMLIKQSRVVVEKAAIIKRHTRPSKLNEQGGILEKEGSVHISNVMVVCHKCDRPVRIGKKVLDDGKKMRVCKRCGEILENI